MSTNLGGGVAEQVLAVARNLSAVAPNAQVKAQAQAVIDRLSGPLRVAIAGREGGQVDAAQRAGGRAVGPHRRR